MFEETCYDIVKPYIARICVLAGRVRYLEDEVEYLKSKLDETKVKNEDK